MRVDPANAVFTHHMLPALAEKQVAMQLRDV